MGLIRGLLAEIRVLPMSLVLLTVIMGGLLAGPVNWWILGLVVSNAFLFLYVAHLNDTLQDLRRREYDPARRLHSVRVYEWEYMPRWGFGPEIPNAPLLSNRVYIAGILICSIAGILLALKIQSLTGPMYLVLALVGLGTALSYSAGIDRIPVFGDIWWEIGVIAALFCGYYVTKLSIDWFIIQAGVVLFIMLFGVKIYDAWYDVECDSRSGKNTLAVVLSKWASLKAIRDALHVPIYLGLGLLFWMLPPPFWLGLSICTATTIYSHLKYRENDYQLRKGIVILGLGIVVLLVYSILVILSFPS